MRGRLGWAVIVLVAVVACGGGSPAAPAVSTGTDASEPLPTLAKSVLPGYVLQTAPLDAEALSNDALDPAELRPLLAGAGFEAGVQQRFTARWKPLTEIRAQILRFRDDEGAAAYVEWIRTHGPDTLGSRAQTSEPPAFPGAVAFSHSPCAGCTKDPAQYVAAWTHGRYALTLLVGGPRAGEARAEPIAEELDRLIGKVDRS
jgi:hypothetical protein